jgi:hypothetical protein
MISILISLVCACATNPPVKPPEEALLSKQSGTWLLKIREIAQTGDWFVVRGYSPADQGVVLATNIPLSHAAIFDKEEGVVIESGWKGVVRTKLLDFINKSHRILIIRPKWWSDDHGQSAITLAHLLVGQKYDFTGLVGLQNDARFYCSELAMQVYHQYFDEDDRIPKVIEPGQMYLWGNVLWDSGSRS